MRAPQISPATRSMSARLDKVGERRLKWTYVTRLVPQTAVAAIGPNSKTPESGDVVVARVYAIAAHDHIEDPVGRAQRLYPGDLIVGAYGNRYATDVYEGYVPRGPQTHLLTASGLIGTVASAHEAVKEPTKLEICGALSGEDGRPLTLAAFASPAPPPVVPPLGTIVVVGSSMNAGKTTTVVSIVRGLTQAGLVVGAGKVTGSGSGKDPGPTSTRARTSPPISWTTACRPPSAIRANRSPRPWRRSGTGWRPRGPRSSSWRLPMASCRARPAGCCTASWGWQMRSSSRPWIPSPPASGSRSYVSMAYRCAP